jgi:hypothetical protein
MADAIIQVGNGTFAVAGQAVLWSNVYPGLSPIALITVPEAQLHPAIAAVASHELIESLIEASTRAIENYLNGRPVVQRQFTHYFAGGVKRLYLPHYPIVSVASVVDDDENTVATADYRVYADEGVLEHVGYWPYPIGRWKVTWTAGLVDQRINVPHHFKEACRRLVAFMTAKATPGAISEKIGDTAIDYESPSAEGAVLDLPYDVRILIDAEMQAVW